MKFQKRKPRRLLTNAERQEILASAVLDYDLLQKHNARASWRREILEESGDKIDASVLLALFDKFSKENIFDAKRASRELCTLERCVKVQDNLCKDIFACTVLAQYRDGHLPLECLKLITWAQGFTPCFYAVELTHLRHIPKDWILSLALEWFNFHFDGMPFKMEVVK